MATTEDDLIVPLDPGDHAPKSWAMHRANGRVTLGPLQRTEAHGAMPPSFDNQAIKAAFLAAAETTFRAFLFRRGRKTTYYEAFDFFDRNLRKTLEQIHPSLWGS